MGRIAYAKDRAQWVPSTVGRIAYARDRAQWVPSTVGRIAYGRDQAMSIKTWAEHCVRTLSQISPMIKCKIRSCH